MDIDLIIKLSDIIIKNTPIKSIDFSGGEPTTHSDFLSQRFKLINWTKKHSQIRFSLHSNGILLKPVVIDQIKDNFSRIGLSIHSVNFDIWNKITNLNNHYSKNEQIKKFNLLMNNIKYISDQNIGDKIFVKSVVIRGVNDSEKELKNLLDFCAENKFHPKFLEFEPQYPDQEKFIVGRCELFEKLEKLGCNFTSDAPKHNDPNSYIPGVNFEYNAKIGAKTGLHSIFGCGDKAACESCYLFLCMFVKSSEDGGGVYLKPCSTLDTRIDLTHAIKKGDTKQILKLFKISREYLMLAPGLGINHWNKENNFKTKLLSDFL